MCIRDSTRAAQPSWPSSRYARREWQRSSPTARLSCKDCVGDVVPEFDLGGCWPLWPQFAPDELQFECKRNWTIPPEYGRKQHRDREVPPVFDAPLACWRTCWTPIVADRATGKVRPTGGATFCNPACPEPGSAAKPDQWRATWDKGLAEWKASSTVGREFAQLETLFKADAAGGWHRNYRTHTIFKVF